MDPLLRMHSLKKVIIDVFPWKRGVITDTEIYVVKVPAISPYMANYSAGAILLGLKDITSIVNDKIIIKAFN